MSKVFNVTLIVMALFWCYCFDFNVWLVFL